MLWSSYGRETCASGVLSKWLFRVQSKGPLHSPNIPQEPAGGEDVSEDKKAILRDNERLVGSDLDAWKS
jgi:hypothetical protein